jgi:hypothetical protein
VVSSVAIDERSHSLCDSPIATQTVPPGVAIAIKNCIGCSRNLNVGPSDLDERVIRVEVLPERLALEDNFGACLQFRQIDGRIARNSNAVKRNGGARRYSFGDAGVHSHVARVNRRRCWCNRRLG